MDWKKYLPVVIGLVADKASPESKVGKAIQWIKKNPTEAALLEGVLSGIFKKIDKKENPVETPVDRVPVPTPPVPAPVEAPKEYSLKDDPNRKVASLKLTFMVIESYQKKALYSKPEFDAIVSLSDPVKAGDRIHFDITPGDQNGNDFHPDHKANDQMSAINPDDGRLVPKMQYEFDSSIFELSSEYDGHGCTPVLKVKKDFKGEYVGGLVAKYPEGPVWSNEKKVRVKS